MDWQDSGSKPPPKKGRLFLPTKARSSIRFTKFHHQRRWIALEDIPQMSTSFGFDWYLQCFMHNFEYNNLTKNKTRPNSKNNKYKETHKTHIHRFEYLMFGFTIAPTFAFRKYECSFHTVLSTKSKNSVCKRSQTRGDSRFKIQFLNPVFQT